MKIEDFDLTNDDIVIGAGKLLGQNLMDEVKEAVMQMTMERRALFFSSFLITPVVCMGASIGVEATNAILDVCKEHVSGNPDWQLADTH